MLITLKKQVTTEEMVEITLPFFSVEETNYGLKNYYAVHENASFDIMFSDKTVRVLVRSDSSLISDAIKHTPITEQDFDFAYQMAIDRLTKSVQPQKQIV